MFGAAWIVAGTSNAVVGKWRGKYEESVEMGFVTQTLQLVHQPCLN